jgi:hypothetical protein
LWWKQFEWVAADGNNWSWRPHTFKWWNSLVEEGNIGGEENEADDDLIEGEYGIVSY